MTTPVIPGEDQVEYKNASVFSEELIMHTLSSSGTSDTRGCYTSTGSGSEETDRTVRFALPLPTTPLTNESTVSLSDLATKVNPPESSSLQMTDDFEEILLAPLPKVNRRKWSRRRYLIIDFDGRQWVTHKGKERPKFPSSLQPVCIGSNSCKHSERWYEGARAHWVRFRSTSRRMACLHSSRSESPSSCYKERFKNRSEQ